jgi:hypothetical protein
MGVFIQTLYETLGHRYFSLAYPISLYFLYKEEKYFNFYTVLTIIILSIIYFYYYYLMRSKQFSSNPIEKKRNLYCIIGFLVQFNLAFFDYYEIKDGELIKNNTLFVLKVLMVLETLKRIYYYVQGIKLLYEMEKGPRGDRCMYVMTFEIVYDYLWENYCINRHSTGYHLPNSFYLTGFIFSIIHGFLAMGCHFIIIKICFGILNLIYFAAMMYSIYWRRRENY